MSLAIGDLVPLTASLLDAGVSPQELEAELRTILGVLTRVYRDYESGNDVPLPHQIPSRNVTEPGYSPEHLILRGGMLKRGTEHTTLPPAAQKLLRLLVAEPGATITFETIKETMDLNDHGIYVTAGTLRTALETIGISTPVLHNRRGSGYYWSTDYPVQVQTAMPA